MKVKNTIVLLSVFVLLISLTGCSSEPKIDGASQKAMSSSFKEILNSVPDENRSRVKSAFQKYVTSLAIQLSVEGDLSPEELKDEVRAEMDGKTANEILELVGEEELSE